MAAPLFNFNAGKRSTEFGRIDVPYQPWLDTQEPEAALLPDLPIIDPHHHLWDYPGYRYLVPELSADIAGGHNVVSTVYAECVSMYREGGPPRFRPLGEVEFAVGQAAQSLSGLNGPVRIADGIIGFADLNLGAAVEEVLHAEIDAANGRFKGVRFSTSWDPAPEVIGSPNDDRPHVLREKPIREGLKTLGRMGLTFDAWLFFTQLDELIDVVDETPGLTFVLDHCGGPLGYGPYAHDKADHYQAWKKRILELAKRPNVVCKVGGVMGRGAAFDYRTAERPPTSELLADLWRPWFEPTIEAFGTDRCMFESNFPLEKMGTNYTVLWNTFKRIAAGASTDEKRNLFSGNAARIYRLETPA
jgi:L-fuconolactonase